MPGPDGHAQAPEGKRRTGLVITAAAVVVALIAGAGVWFFASRSTNSASGAASPQAAVVAFASSINNADPLGTASQLAPAEAALFTDANESTTEQLKRLQILLPDASPHQMSGTSVKVSGLTYDQAAEETINDHVKIVKLTGGTITITSDPSKLPITDKVKSALGPAFETPRTETVNIADVVKKDGQPIRIAVQKVNDKWYVSLFYTIADNIAHASGAGNPTPADAIPAVGAATPDAAMNQLLSDIGKGDAKGVIALLDPNSMAALHDYGGLILAKSDENPTDLGVSFSDAKWTVSDVPGGKKVSLGALTITTKDGEKIVLKRDPAASTLSITAPGQPTITLDANNLDSILGQATDMAASIPPEALDIVKREFAQIIGVGVVMTQSGGQWYVDPGRTVFDVLTSLLKGLEPGDIDKLIAMADR